MPVRVIIRHVHIIKTRFIVVVVSAQSAYTVDVMMRSVQYCIIPVRYEYCTQYVDILSYSKVTIIRYTVGFNGHFNL